MNAQTHPSSPTLADCSSEQLHLSGRIQAHGALVAADLQDRRVTYASANTPVLIGAAPDQLFDSPVMSIFSPVEQQRLEQAIEQTGDPPSPHDLYGMRLAAAFDGKVDVILHQVGGQIVIEIERAYGDDQANLLPVLYASEAIGEARSVPEVEAAVASAVRALTGSTARWSTGSMKTGTARSSLRIASQDWSNTSGIIFRRATFRAKRANRILDRNGGPCQVAQLLAEREKLRQEIEQLDDLMHRYGQLAAGRLQLDREVVRLEEEKNTAEYESRVIELAIGLRDRWRRRDAMDDELAALGPQAPLPPDAIRRLDALNARIHKHQQQLQGLRRQRQELRSEAAALAVNEALRRQAPRIEAMQEQLPWIAALEGQAAGLEKELAELSAAVAAEHKGLGLDERGGPIVLPSLSPRTLGTLRSAGRAVLACRPKRARHGRPPPRPKRRPARSPRRSRPLEQPAGSPVARRH